LLALILADAWRVSRGRPAGIGVGIAAAVKLTPAIFIVFFLLAGRTKAAFTAVGTLVVCGLIGLLIAPDASALYWRQLVFDTRRVGASPVSNQSPYGMAVRIAGGQGYIAAWWIIIPITFAVIGLGTAAVLARRRDWLGATTVSGTTGLLVSPIFWTHHWMWILPALVLLARSGRRIAAVAGYALFALAPVWFPPRSAVLNDEGFHWLLTLAANCFLIAGLAFLAYMTWSAHGLIQPGEVADDGESARPPAGHGANPRLISGQQPMARKATPSLAGRVEGSGGNDSSRL
jgi:alpha-1,2-mannosyltransferase